MIVFLARRVAALTAVLAAVSILAFAAAAAAGLDGGEAGSLLARYLSWLMGLVPDAAAQARLWSTAALNGAAVLIIVLVSLPAAIYAATRPGAGGDRAVGLLAGLALAAPPFLIAVVVTAAAGGLPGTPWPEGAAPAWERVWLPALLVGAWGSGHMIRHLRRDLARGLDGAAVMGARARGLSRRWAFWRFAVGVALGPFFAGLGRLVPQLVSASIVVSWVLALPTAGALMLESLMGESLGGRDFGLAATALVHLTAATAAGVLAVDLLRLVVDPRLRRVATTWAAP